MKKSVKIAFPFSWWDQQRDELIDIGVEFGSVFVEFKTTR